MTTAARKQASAKYDAAHTRQLKMKLNLGTDADIIEKLDELDNVQGYIKELIRADIREARHDAFYGDMLRELVETGQAHIEYHEPVDSPGVAFVTLPERVTVGHQELKEPLENWLRVRLCGRQEELAWGKDYWTIYCGNGGEVDKVAIPYIISLAD